MLIQFSPIIDFDFERYKIHVS